MPKSVDTRTSEQKLEDELMAAEGTIDVLQSEIRDMQEECAANEIEIQAYEDILIDIRLALDIPDIIADEQIADYLEQTR